jgi:hypothetical protein
LAPTGDPLSADPLCPYEPEGRDGDSATGDRIADD